MFYFYYYDFTTAILWFHKPMLLFYKNKYTAVFIWNSQIDSNATLQQTDAISVYTLTNIIRCVADK